MIRENKIIKLTRLNNMQVATLHIPGPACMSYGCLIANKKRIFVWPDKGKGKQHQRWLTGQLTLANHP